MPSIIIMKDTNNKTLQQIFYLIILENFIDEKLL
jgi:hypothetical protein